MSVFREDEVTRFYIHSLDGEWSGEGRYEAPCPFCLSHGKNETGRLVVILNQDSFFHGYFRCDSRCVPGGFPHWFATLANIPYEKVPGYDPDMESPQTHNFPIANLNDEVRAYRERIPEHLLDDFSELGITDADLAEIKVGFNGRYITWPYVQQDGNCYSMRCVHPDKKDDYFWHGDEQFFTEPFQIFNIQEIDRCIGGTLFLCEGEENLLILKHLGYPAIAIPHASGFETLDVERFQYIHTLFLLTPNSVESQSFARDFAARAGFKVRLLSWPSESARNYDLAELARETKGKPGRDVAGMVRNSITFSPFPSPEWVYATCLTKISQKKESEYERLKSGFPLLDNTLGGIYGINILGGAPKVGKSAFTVQLASQLALNGVPVIYYDFENGAQQLYQRMLSRMGRIEVKDLPANIDDNNAGAVGEEILQQFKTLLDSLRVVNDRKLDPELMRRHIDFIRHERRSKYTVVVVDSLHKLPFKNVTERRTGIDAWLREFESIRDEMQVSFLVISELSRGEALAYGDEPHLGIFKGSGDIEYSADNAMVLHEQSATTQDPQERRMTLTVVASREHRPGPVASYRLDYPYWGFVEEPLG